MRRKSPSCLRERCYGEANLIRAASPHPPFPRPSDNLFYTAHNAACTTTSRPKDCHLRRVQLSHTVLVTTLCRRPVTPYSTANSMSHIIYKTYEMSQKSFCLAHFYFKRVLRDREGVALDSCTCTTKHSSENDEVLNSYE